MSADPVAAAHAPLERADPPRAAPEELAELAELLGALRHHVQAVEREARSAATEARSARDEVLRLRDEVVAAERDQQDLRAVRARLDRLRARGLLARILNRDDTAPAQHHAGERLASAPRTRPGARARP